MARRRYLKKPDTFVIAVQLDLDTEGFTYEKWGAQQTCKAGDWLVNNAGDVYTVDREVFERTYRESGPGAYVKVTPVWAEVAEKAGSVHTMEGETHYEAGWYLVSNDPDGHDSWAVSPKKFERMYDPAS